MMRAVCALLVTLLAACSQGTLPESGVFIRGTIASGTFNQGLLVEAAPGTEYESDKAYVRVSSSTDLRYRDGRSASRDQLAAGTEVSVWHTGIVLESYPPQVSARAIVIESSVLR